VSDTTQHALENDRSVNEDSMDLICKGTSLT